MNKFEASVMVEIEWPFKDGSPDHKFCLDRAAFAHREACEFILHIGAKNEDFWSNMAADMQSNGCSKKFINAYLAAKDLGAIRVLFYA